MQGVLQARAAAQSSHQGRCCLLIFLARIVRDERKNAKFRIFLGKNPYSLAMFLFLLLDFCHVDSDNSDDVYTNFSFVEMRGRTIWPFYTTETFQEDLWIWISPRRFAIISGHPHNEKLNHFYSNKMHEHHILANRAICWSFNEIETDASKKKDRIIAGPPMRPSSQALSISME